MTSPETKTTTIPPFTLSSPLGTDIWRKPPSIDVFSAPTHPSPLPKYPLPSFQRARLTVSLPPAHTLRQFDQAGLILHFTSPNAQPGSQKDKWIKTGIEFFNEKPYLGTAGADNWSDWSVVPIHVEGRESRVEVTVEVRRERDELGKSLWVYQIGGEGERVPLREVNWVFAEEEGWSIGVGGYVARETEGEGKDELEAEFGDGLEIEVLQIG